MPAEDLAQLERAFSLAREQYAGRKLGHTDEEMFSHKPFAVIADAFARAGIATLRYDDRGFGEEGCLNFSPE